MSRLTDLEHKHHKYKEFLNEELVRAESNAKRYARQFVRSNKQDDRHSAMEYAAISTILRKLLKLL